MEIISLQGTVFYALIDKVIEHIQQQYAVRAGKWISGNKAMKKLLIQSKTILHGVCDELSPITLKIDFHDICYEKMIIELDFQRFARYEIKEGSDDYLLIMLQVALKLA